MHRLTCPEVMDKLRLTWVLRRQNSPRKVTGASFLAVCGFCKHWSLGQGQVVHVPNENKDAQ